MSALVVTDLSKTFAGTTVLKRVSLDVAEGEVHALVGQNGSGKSTLIKVLAGYHAPDDGGSAAVHGEPLRLGSAGDAQRLNLRFVHQDLGLVNGLSVTENVMLGRRYPRRPGGTIDWGAAHRAADAAIRRTGPAVDVRSRIEDLGVADRTRVAIARALPEREDPAVVVLDEPTAALPEADVRELFAAIRRLTSAGNAVILVSHHLDEVLEIADRVTVLRDGEKVGTAVTSGMDGAGLARMIIGKDLVKETARIEVAERRTCDLVAVRGLTGGPVRDLDFTVGAGEILGIAGLAGSGREFVAAMVTGAAPREGEVHVDGVPVVSHQPRAALRAGMAWVYGDRAKYGVFPELDVRSNLTMGDLRRHLRWSALLSARAERAEVREWIGELGIVASGSEAAITSLSGGNQQKVLVARALRLTPRLLVLDDPTAGIDIGAREQVHRIIERTTTQDSGVLLTSSDSDELARVCDRVLVLSRGRICAELRREDGIHPHDIDHAQVAGAAA